MSSAKPIPDGYHTVTPMLCARDADKLLRYLEQAFDARLKERHDHPDGRIMHAEIRIGDSLVMLSEASEPMPPMPASLYLYVPDVDAVHASAVAAGGESLMAPADMFWGDRSASVKDPAGNMWWISTHVEDVAPDELDRRAAAYAEQCGPPQQ